MEDNDMQPHQVIPRPDFSRPQLQPIVPNISLMFDSEDSLVWKPNRTIQSKNNIDQVQETLLNNKVITEAKSTPCTKENTEKPDILGSKIENIFGKIDKQLAENLTHISTRDSPKKTYNPDQYASPVFRKTASLDTVQKSAPKVHFAESTSQETNEVLPNLSDAKSHQFPHSVNEPHVKYQLHQKNNKMIQNEIPYTINAYQPNPFQFGIYTLIENQNRQIFQLQYDIKEVMNKINESNICKLQDEADLQKVVSKYDNKKVAIVQTSIIEQPTRTIGINTDISWNDLIEDIKIELLNNQQQSKETHNVYEERNAEESQNYDQQVQLQVAHERKEISLKFNNDIKASLLKRQSAISTPPYHGEYDALKHPRNNTNDVPSQQVLDGSPLLGGDTASVYQRRQMQNSREIDQAKLLALDEHMRQLELCFRDNSPALHNSHGTPNPNATLQGSPACRPHEQQQNIPIPITAAHFQQINMAVNYSASPNKRDIPPDFSTITSDFLKKYGYAQNI